MARRKKITNSSDLNTAKNYVRGSVNPWTGVTKARHLVPASDMEAFINWLPTVKRNGQGIDFNHFPKSVSELWQSGTLTMTTLSRELAWATAIFKSHTEKLSVFQRMSEEYENLFVQDRYKDCHAQLDAMERLFGISLWIIETRIALLQRSDGLEAQKLYAAKIREARSKNDIVAFLVYNLSRRNEPSSTPFRYIEELEVLVSGWENAQALSSYLLYRLANKIPKTSAQYADILRHEYSASLIDQYETFVRLSACAGAMGEEKVRAAFRLEAQKIPAMVNDQRLQRAVFLLSEDIHWLDEISTEGAQAEDAFAAGDYDLAVKIGQASLLVNPEDALAWGLVARASSIEKSNDDLEENFAFVTIGRLRQLISRTDDAKAANALYKDALNHRLQNFSPVLDSLIWGELATVPGSLWQLEGLAFVYGSGLRPSDVGRVRSPEAVRAVAAQLKMPGHSSLALAEHLMRAGLNETWSDLPEAAVSELPNDVALEAKVVRALRNEAHADVLELSDQLSSSPDPMRRRRAKRYIAHSLLKTNRIVDLATLIARSSVADPGIVGMLPLDACARKLDRLLRRENAGNIAIPIVLDLFSKHRDDSLDDLRSYSYEDFLISHGIDFPSQLDGKENEFEINLLNYYLRHVCVPNVMQVSSAYQGTRELEDERKKVLSLLVKLDPDSAKDYEAELREVTRAQLIHRGVRQVERSKIYVDVPAIRRAFDKAHRETFQRHQALSLAGIGTDDRELENALNEALTGKPLPQEVMQVPKNETNDLLLQMLRWLFAECTASPEHGLDCYLSMRIRHGTLSGQLRTPLEIERIITQRSAYSNEYESNLYWMEQLDHLDDACCAAIDARLAQFSADYDNLIAQITRELIQIQSVDKPYGLFNLQVKSVRFLILMAGLSRDLSFEEFFDALMEIFWESVEHALETVRKTIDIVLKRDISIMFADLEGEIVALADGVTTSDLDRAIRTSHTGTLQALDIVKDWFRLSQPISEPIFPIGDLIDVGLQCVTAIHHEFAPVVICDLDPLPPFAGALVLFSDIFFIIFDNVRRHSGVGARPNVRIEVRDEGDRLRIVARNEVAAGVRTLDTTVRIEAIRQAIAEGDYQRAVRTEGGTGLIKLRKLIRLSEGETPHLAFGFEGDEFIVDLELRKLEIAR